MTAARKKNGVEDKRAALEARAEWTPQRVADFHASLEHLITIGSKVRHDEERRQVFQNVKERLLEQTHMLPLDHVAADPEVVYATNASDTEGRGKRRSPTSGTNTPTTERMLAEDFRIYGEIGWKAQGFAKLPWPRRRTAKRPPPLNNSDKEWNIEHGDDIHPIAFSLARLSEHTDALTEEDLLSVNGSNLHLSTTDTSVPITQVPRALLLRCWERAVHVASSTIPAQVGACVINGYDPENSAAHVNQTQGGPEPAMATFVGGTILGLGETTPNEPIMPTPSPPQKQPEYVSRNESIARERKATIAKCQSLGIALDMIQLDCPACRRSFPSHGLLKDHYFGKPSDCYSEKGCCWRLVPQRHTELIAGVLESHVKAQIDTFLGCVLQKANAKIPDTDCNVKKRRRLLNWYDILKFAETSVQEAKYLVDTSVDESSPGKHPILETLQAKSKSAPLVLNPTILKRVRERLVDRYADLAP